MVESDHRLTWAALHSRLKTDWYNLQSSYWFVPAVMVIVAVGLAFFLGYVDQVYVDRALFQDLPVPLRWLMNATEASARSLLETIAGSMISVAAVSYSMTLVVLTLASSQYGPRILQLFKQDRISQVVLGLLMALTAYSLVLLNMVGNPEAGRLVPRIGLLVAFIWVLVDVGAFLRFFSPRGGVNSGVEGDCGGGQGCGADGGLPA